MSKRAAAASREPGPPAFAPPYPPSLVDRLIAWLDRQPVPVWLILLAAAAVVLAILTAVQWREGAYAVGTFNPLHAMASAYVPFLVWLIRYLDRSAASALQEFRPALMSESEAMPLRYRLTTLPRTATLFVGGATALAIGLMAWLFSADLRLLEVAPTLLSEAVFGAVLIATWWATGVFVYHTVRQLVLIHEIYTRRTRIDVFQLTPLYAFSHHTRRTAVAILLFVYLDFLIADPTLRYHPLNLGVGATLALLAVVAFVGPLGGVHRLLAAEKTRLVDDNARRLEAGFRELQKRMDSLRLAGADDLNKTLSSLEIERTALLRIPTWPWEPGTIRGLAAALLLPILIWLIQFALGRWLG
ncbi:MAG TPA: hypothetical protein VLD63_00110 [Anaerolineales bacterium]|nr:hypothetical protein [Anaerolineales bacterium]